MAKHMVKCLYCGQTFDASKEEFVKPKANRYAHKSCAEKYEASKTKEEKDKERLEEYIKELFNITTLTSKIKNQIKMYAEKKYTYSGMWKSLKYFYEVKGNSIEKAQGGIGIIPYVWDEAFNYWRALWEAQERNKEIKAEQFILPAREIHIEPPQRQPMKHTRKLFTFLDEEEDST